MEGGIRDSTTCSNTTFLKEYGKTNKSLLDAWILYSNSIDYVLKVTK